MLNEDHNAGIGKKTKYSKSLKMLVGMVLLHSGRDYITYHPNWDRPGERGQSETMPGKL